MRVTLRIPDEFYKGIMPRLDSLGYTSLNDYLLSFLRVPELRQNDTPKEVRQIDTVIHTSKEAVKKVKEISPDAQFCSHGARIGLCKLGCKK